MMKSPAEMKSGSTPDGWISFHLRSRFHPWNTDFIVSKANDFIKIKAALYSVYINNFDLIFILCYDCMHGVF